MPFDIPSYQPSAWRNMKHAAERIRSDFPWNNHILEKKNPTACKIIIVMIMTMIMMIIMMMMMMTTMMTTMMTMIMMMMTMIMMMMMTLIMMIMTMMTMMMMMMMMTTKTMMMMMMMTMMMIMMMMMMMTTTTMMMMLSISSSNNVARVQKEGTGFKSLTHYRDQWTNHAGYCMYTVWKNASWPATPMCSCNLSWPWKRSYFRT